MDKANVTGLNRLIPINFALINKKSRLLGNRDWFLSERKIFRQQTDIL
jgi:hypothetical protein